MRVTRHSEANDWQATGYHIGYSYFPGFQHWLCKRWRDSTSSKAARLLKPIQERYNFAMTGIEVAGLVLGAFPLLLSAIEKNHEAHQIFGDWWKIRKRYRSCSKWVQAEHDLFEDHIRNLLNPVLVDTAMLDELLADPYGQKWRSESLASDLRDVLPTNFSSCIFMMEQFHENMIALGRELGIDKQAFQRAVNVSLDVDLVVARLLTQHGRQPTRAQAWNKAIYEGL